MWSCDTSKLFGILFSQKFGLGYSRHRSRVRRRDPNAKRDVVSPPGKFPGHLGVSWLNCSFRLATLDDGHLVVTLPQTHCSDSKGLWSGQIRMRLKGRTALRIE